MIAKDAAKRKRQIQPTIDALFKRQRVVVLKSDRGGTSSTMSHSEVQDVSDTILTTKLDEYEHSESTIMKDDEKVDPSLLKDIAVPATLEETLEYDMGLEITENELCNEPVRLGTPITTLNRAPDCCASGRPLHPHPEHTILFRPHVCADKPPRPYPDAYRDTWDRNHVRMPCSKESLYPVKDVEKKLVSRWELIRTSLLRPMTSSYDLEEAILAYNAHYAKRWNFRTLHLYLLEKMTMDEHKEFFNVTLPAIIQLALHLPNICTQAIPLLKKQKQHTVTMSQQQASSLLANAFLCTFPRRNGVKMHSQHEFGNYPEINFSRLFQGDNRENSSKLQKLKCIFHYFKKATERPSFGTISFTRQVLAQDEIPKWHNCSATICRLHVSSDGKIEDDATGLVQVDFANEFVGGGVLGEGCVQEEIRFAICPEMILSRLFTERLEENECLIITGAERFSNYSGYADTFRWTSNHTDTTPRDSWGRLYTEVVAIDAKPYSRFSEQFAARNLKRDLDKAFCGFFSRGTPPPNVPAIATGKWGCGAFNGDRELKGLIQIMAASASSRDLVYFTFNDKPHAKDLHHLHCLLKERKVTVGDLWQILNDYRKELDVSRPRTVFSYIYQVLEEKQNSENSSGTTAFRERTSPLLFDESPS